LITGLLTFFESIRDGAHESTKITLILFSFLGIGAFLWIASFRTIDIKTALCYLAIWFSIIGCICLPSLLLNSYINESKLIKNIVISVTPKAARSSNPEEYAKQAIYEALAEEGKNLDKYIVDVTMPQGYEYQKPLIITILYLIEGNTVIHFLLGNYIGQAARDLLNGSTVLKATLTQETSSN